MYERYCRYTVWTAKMAASFAFGLVRYKRQDLCLYIRAAAPLRELDNVCNLIKRFDSHHLKYS